MKTRLHHPRGDQQKRQGVVEHAQNRQLPPGAEAGRQPLPQGAQDDEQGQRRNRGPAEHHRQRPETVERDVVEQE